MSSERLGLADAINADHQAKATSASRLDPRERVLEHSGLRGSHGERSRTREKRVRGWLPMQMIALGDDAVDDLFE